MIRRAIWALAAAFLFGLSTPGAKALLGHVDSVIMAGLLYLGSGLGLGIFVLLKRTFTPTPGPFLVFRNRHEPIFLGGAILFGGVIAPVLLMTGLARLSASVSSLLLNLETVFTALIACLVFREKYGPRLVLGMAFIVGGGVLLSAADSFGGMASGSGILAIAGACAFWAIDNNLTRKIESLDAPTLAAMKGLAAGAANSCLGLLLQHQRVRPSAVWEGMVIGFFGYGLSLVFFVFSLRKIGTARTSAYFSTAPFVGALAGVLFFREPITGILAVSGASMAFGVWLHLTESVSGGQPF